MKKKLGLFCMKGLNKFVDDLVPVFSEDYDVKICLLDQQTEIETIVSLVEESDVIFCEWANESTAYITNLDKYILGKKRVVVRLHSYEVLTGHMLQVNWENVTDVVFVAKHVQELFNTILKQHFPKISFDFQQWLIPNGIDTERYSLLPNKNHGNNIAFIGFISDKKGPMLLIETLSHLAQLNCDIKLHVAGTCQDARYQQYLNYMIKENQLENNILFYNWVHNICDWLQDMNYVICTSPWESQNLSVMEAMSRGIKPLVHNFPGSKNIYPKDCIWTHLFELEQMVFDSSYDSEAYRNWIVEKYNIIDMKEKWTKLFESEKSCLILPKGFEK